MNHNELIEAMNTIPDLHEQLRQLNQKVQALHSSLSDGRQDLITAKRAREDYDLGKTFFYQLVKDGLITLYRIPGTRKVYVKRSELDAIFEPTEVAEVGSTIGERA